MTLNFTPIHTKILSCDTEEDKKPNNILPINCHKREKKSQSLSFPFGKCHICHDNATGVHYGVITCEGCKGFFKRCMIQGITYRCYFGEKCVINLETRNRCKACRFNRCIEQGMSMENVKLGRIPKNIKAKALRDQRTCQEMNDDDNSEKSSKTSDSSPSTNTSTSDSNEKTPEVIIIPTEIVNSPKQSFRTLDLIEVTFSSSVNLNNNLSLLRLPNVFHATSSSISSPTDILSHSNEISDDLLMDNNNTIMTVSRYISNLSENSLIDYMFNCELRYSKNVLQIMKYVLPKLYQPFLIYELDFELMSFFRYIRWKMLNFYLKHTIRIRELVQRMFGIINLGITEYPGVAATIENMWEGVQAGISIHVKELLDFAHDTLGFNELNLTDFTRIMNNRVFDFWIIMNYPLFYQNETYIMTPNGLQYTRFFMSKFIGKTTTDALHEFSERLHALNLTQIEHSLIIPIVICQPDPQLTDPEAVHTIKHNYMYALYIQLCSTRTEDEAKILFNKILQVIADIEILDELCKKNIGEVVLDKVTTCE